MVTYDSDAPDVSWVDMVCVKVSVTAEVIGATLTGSASVPRKKESAEMVLLPVKPFTLTAPSSLDVAASVAVLG